MGKCRAEPVRGIVPTGMKLLSNIRVSYRIPTPLPRPIRVCNFSGGENAAIDLGLWRCQWASGLSLPRILSRDPAAEAGKEGKTRFRKTFNAPTVLTKPPPYFICTTQTVFGWTLA